MEGHQEGVAGGCVREVAKAGAVRSQSYQDAPERLEQPSDFSYGLYSLLH